MDAPIRWSDGALELLDQTRLPVEQRWIRCESPEDVAGAIRRLAVRGAPLSGRAAAYGVALGMRTAAADESAHARFAAVAPVLDSSRPTAANLAWALERARELVDQRDGAPARELADPLLQLADRLASEQREADGRMAELGARLLHPGDRVLTHCNTGALATGGLGTAGGVLAAAWDAGRLAEVWVDETRPLLQGARLTAWELGGGRVPVTLVAGARGGALLTPALVGRAGG